MDKIFLIIAMLSCISALSAQTNQKEEFVIPLSKPGQPGILEVGLHRGGVKVTGYDGKDVRITMTVIGDGKASSNSASEKSGLKRINNNSIDVQIEEYDNVIEISGDNSRQTDFVIQVPRKFDLSIGTHHNGDVFVDDVTGTMEVNCHFGKMILHNISGSLIADTHHGTIEVTFKEVETGKPMAFSTYHGDVDVTFPASANFAAKVKTTKGEIYTDFDVNMVMQKPDDQVDEDGRRQIRVGGWMFGQIGSGGEEFMFNSYHGDIIIRKK